jgi:hypothetical protein
MVYPCYHQPPVSFFSVLVHDSGPVMIEQHDHYTKQTYRNRCRVLGANGVINLVIPVVKQHGQKTFMKDVRIDYDTDWQRIHWQSILSSYASAPFFEFMEDSYQPVYQKKYTFLLDLNIDLLQIALELLQIPNKVEITAAFERCEPETDLAVAIHPKKPFMHKTILFHPAEYHQVFTGRHGFQQDLSIIDLLFNEGPNAVAVLKASAGCT